MLKVLGIKSWNRVPQGNLVKVQLSDKRVFEIESNAGQDLCGAPPVSDKLFWKEWQHYNDCFFEVTSPTSAERAAYALDIDNDFGYTHPNTRKNG